MTKKEEDQKKEALEQTEDKLSSQSEEESEELSAWQRLNKEYREKKAQEKAQKEKEREELKRRMAGKPEPEETSELEAEQVDDEELDEEAEEQESEALEDEKDELEEEELDKKTLKKKRKEEKKQAKLEAKKALGKIKPVHLYRAFPVLLVSILLALASIYFISPYSKLKQVTVSGNQQVATGDILGFTKIHDEDYTLTTFLKQTWHASNVKAASPWIDKVEMTYQFPINFTIQIKEYSIVAYDYSGDQYYPVLSSGEEVPTAVNEDTLPKKYIKLQFSDKPMLKSFVQQLSTIKDSIKDEIQTVEHTPSKATADLLTINMADGNKILVPLSELAKKLPYYEGIKPQLTEISTIDMEAGIYSYTSS